MQTAPSQVGPSVRSVSLDAPWAWLAMGWSDLKQRPLISLGYGAVFTLMGLFIAGGAFLAGVSALVPVAAGAFMLVGPLLAVGLYEMSRRYAAGEAFALGDVLFVRSAARLQLVYMGFGLMFLLLVWIRVATLLFALFTSGTYPNLAEFTVFALQTPNGYALLILGTAIGAAIAFVVYAVSAISVPMLMDRDVDFVTAILTSLSAVRRNPGPMLLWAWIIALLVGAGLATCFLGLIVAFPWIGHATWHAYRDLTSPSRTG